MASETLSLVTVPLFSGAIGYATNWSGIWMLFYPVRFAGVKVPGLARLANILPRRIQQIPGVMVGGMGWQGIIPSRAAKMGSIAVDTGIAKVGGPSEFYEHLDPEALAEHMIESARGDFREMVERIIEREHPQLWRELPPELRERIHARVEKQLPDIVRSITGEIGDHIDQLLDVKLMVIRRIEERPELVNRVFLEVAPKELRFIIRFGFLFGFLLGIPTAVLTVLVFPDWWWLLPLLGTFIGYITNVVAIWMIFEPKTRRRLGPFSFQGLFMRRQPQVAEVYSNIIAEDLVNLRNIGEELLNGPRSDRTRQMIETCMHPAVDRAVGPARPAIRMAVGPREYDAIRAGVAVEAVEYTMTPLTDEDFNRRQTEAVRALIEERIGELEPHDFQELLRSAMREDEWLLYLHGAVLGVIGGLLHLLIFG
jgi:uncharacterized membrane protein YheB (UPF0754 family)